MGGWAASPQGLLLPGGSRAVGLLLGRVGAGGLAPELAALALRLGQVCAVSERVFAPLLAQLAER